MLIILLGLSSWQMSAQTIVEIPTTGGTTGNSYLPSYSFYNYSLTQQIYTAAEIGMPGTINSVAFYNDGSTKTRSYTMYMVNTSKQSFTNSTDWITVTAADKVFTGSVTMTGSAWTTIQLDSAFVYDGASNLAIIMDDNTGSYSSGMSCYVFDATGMALRVYSDGTNYDPMAPSGYSGTVMDVKNHIKLDITPANVSCHSVGAMVVSNVTHDNANISWGTPSDAGSYILQYKTSNMDWNDNGVVTDYPYDTTYDFNYQLLPQTDYNVRVANMCTNGDTSMWRTITFRTACSTIDSFPYIENFDNWGTGGAANYPECWTRANTYTSGTTPYVSSTSYQGAGSLYFYVGSASQYNMAIMHAIDPMTPINTLQISFAYRASNSTDRLIVGVVDDITDGSTFTPVDTVYPVAGSVSTWDERIVLFNNYTGTGSNIAFKNEYTTTGCYAYIDNLRIEPIVPCSKPTDVTITNYTTEGADIDWTPGASEDSWEVVAVLAGADVSTGTPEPATSHPYTLTGLNDNTTYDIYVRGVCGGGDYSGWTFKRTFKTNPECSSPRNVHVSQITTSSALVTWDNSVFGTPTYTVGYTEAGQNNWITQTVTGATQYMLSGLTLNTQYNVYVAPNCTTGHADSVVVNFQTRSCLVGGDLQIGDGTEISSYLPEYCLYNYSYTQQIFLASEMNGPAAISSIAFDADDIANANRTLQIYLMHTNAASGNSWINASTAQQVYSGSTTLTTGWNTFNFTTPFQYNGIDNLAVIMIDATGTWSGSNDFKCHITNQSLSRYVYQDSSPYSTSSTPSDGTTTTYRNNVIFGVPCDSTNTCAAPNVYVTGSTDNSLTVAWIPGNVETSWELEYHTEADTNWVSASSVTSPYTITNLSENMDIVVRLRAVCGAGATSEWAATSGRTSCSIINSLPFTEDFDNPTSTAPNNRLYCWSSLTNSSSSYPYVSSSYANSGNYSVYFYGSSAYFSYLISPEFDASIALNTLQVRFWAYKTSPTYYVQVGVMTDPNDHTTFTQLSGNLSPADLNTWNMMEANLDNYTGNGHYIAIRIPQSYASYMYVDDIYVDVIPTCAHVDSIHVYAQPDAATIDWVPGGSESAWDVAVVPGTGAVDFDTLSLIQVTGTPSVTVNNLAQNTVYTVYVRANCGGDYSFWWDTRFMTTQVPATLPYYCDFEDTTQVNEFAFVNGTQTNKWYVGTAANNGGTHAMYISDNNGASNTYTIGSASTVWAYRDIEFPANPSGYTFSFDWHCYGESGYDFLNVYVGTPAPVEAGTPSSLYSGATANPAGTTVLQTTTNSTYPQYFNLSTNYQTYTTTLPGLTQTTVQRVYFLWRNDGSVGDTPPAAVDNISIDAIFCAAPTALTLDSVSATTADLSWTSTSLSGSVLSYKADNDANWTEINPATSPYQITNLTANTHYVVRVADICDDGVNTSPNVTISFYTACGMVSTLPYTENFDGYTASTSTRPNCWAFPITYSDAPYITANSSSSSPNSLFFQSETTNPTTAVSPQIDADIHTLRVKFMLKAESTTSSGTFDVGVMSDPTNVSTFESVRIIQPANTSWNQYVVDFDSTTMTGNGRYIAFRQHSNSSVYYYWLDNVTIMNIPTCPEPDNLMSTGSTSTSVTLGWTAGSETSWNIEYGSAGFTPGTGTLVTVTTNPYTVDNLTSGTAYDFYVQADCGGGDESIWTGPLTAIPGTINMPATGSSSISACDVIIYDNGGATGDYSSNCDAIMTINPDAPMNLVAIQGTLSTESCCDYLRVYDGPNTSGTLLGEFRDEGQTIQQLVSTTGPLTLQFHSDGSIQKSGFALTVTCIPNTCPKPTNLTVSNITLNSADLSWTPGGSESSWIVEYKEASASNWTVDNATTNSYTLSNLSSGTAYDVRVKADCISETSLYTTATFSTECTIISTFPYTENFDAVTTTLPNCWTSTGTGTNWEVTSSFEGSITTAHSGSKAIQFYQGGRGDEATLQMPTLDLSSLTNPMISFWYTNEAWSSDQDEMKVYYRTSSSGTWTQLATYNSDVDTWTFDSLALPSPSATYQIKFEGISDYGYGINLDDITIYDGTGGSGTVNPTVATNAASSIGQTSATLNATITNPDNVTITAKGFEWKATTGGTYTQIAGTGTGNTFTANLTGLTANTGYTFKAFITYNGTTVYGSEMTFTTLNQQQETCAAPTNVTASNITNNSADISWTQQGDVTSWDVNYRVAGADAWNSVTTTTNPYTLSGLSDNTSYEVQVIAHCTNGVTSDPSATITLTTTGINDYTLDNTVTVYPNPTTGMIQIQNSESRIENVEVYDAYGKMLNVVSVNDNVTAIDLTSYASGTYFVRVMTEKGVVTKRVVKN